MTHLYYSTVSLEDLHHCYCCHFSYFFLLPCSHISSIFSSQCHPTRSRQKDRRCRLLPSLLAILLLLILWLFGFCIFLKSPSSAISFRTNHFTGPSTGSLFLTSWASGHDFLLDLPVTLGTRLSLDMGPVPRGDRNRRSQDQMLFDPAR